MVALETKRDHSAVYEIVSKYCILDSFVKYDGYSISSKGFISTLVDIMVIRVNFTHSSPIQFADSWNVYVHSSNLLFDHFQFDGRCCERASEGRHIETIS